MLSFNLNSKITAYLILIILNKLKLLMSIILRGLNCSLPAHHVDFPFGY
eukprot:UN00719